MKAGTILFGGTDLGLYGNPRFTISRTPDPAPPARATHWRIEITVSVELKSEMPATIWARVRKLQELLSSRREGLLEIRDENGTALAWQAVPGENSLPEAISRGYGRVELHFSAIQPIAADDFPLLITIDPLNGDPSLLLNRVTSWSENIRVNRPDTRAPNRSEVASTLTFAARSTYADPQISTALRSEALIAEAERIKALAGKQVQLTFAGFDRTIQIESIEATPSTGWEWIDLQAQARYTSLPGETEAEVQFDVSEEEDPTTGETRISVSGTVEAPDKATADAKIDAFIAAYRTSTRRVLKVKRNDKWLDGEDAVDDPTWIGKTFEIELSQGSSDARYNLKIDTRDGQDGKRITYSGSAFASSLEVLLATVATAAGNKHPVELSSELSLEYTTDSDGSQRLGQATFTHEYQVASGFIRGAVSRGTGNGLFEDATATLAGTITAPDFASATIIARSLIPPGVILRTDDEKQSSAFYGTLADGSNRIEQGISVEFNYAWGTDHTKSAISYKDSSSPDYSRMVETRLITGTAFAANQATAVAQVNLLLAGLSLSNPSQSTFEHTRERMGNHPIHNDRWLSFNFSYSFETSITGTIGHDIIEASWTIQRTGMVNHEPMTEVPLARPVKQSAFGYNIGRLSASGNVKARQQSTARNWGQGKRTSVANFGGNAGSEDPPDESMSSTMIPFNGTTAAFFEFRFTYTFRYAAGLEGLWPGGLSL